METATISQAMGGVRISVADSILRAMQSAHFSGPIAVGGRFGCRLKVETREAESCVVPWHHNTAARRSHVRGVDLGSFRFFALH